MNVPWFLRILVMQGYVTPKGRNFIYELGAHTVAPWTPKNWETRIVSVSHKVNYYDIFVLKLHNVMQIFISVI